MSDRVLHMKDGKIIENDRRLRRVETVEPENNQKFNLTV